MVQLGNEITPGLLWNEGRVGGSFNTPQQWSQLATLLKAASEGVHQAFPVEPAPEIMIHLDSGGSAIRKGKRCFLVGPGMDGGPNVRIDLGKSGPV